MTEKARKLAKELIENREAVFAFQHKVLMEKHKQPRRGIIKTVGIVDFIRYCNDRN